MNVDEFIDPVLAAFDDALLGATQAYAAGAYLKGSAEMIAWGRTKKGLPKVFEGPPIQEAINYAQEHCATLVKQVDETTKKSIVNVISNGIKEKRGIDGIQRDLRNMFKKWQRGDEMSPSRARVIARTETADALEQAFVDRAKDMKVTGKEWITFDPCSICGANEAEGVKPLDHVFSSGHERPPAHPNCRCALAPVML